MKENLSKISKVYESLGKYISEDDRFSKIPIKWALYEVSPNNMPPTLIVFEGRPYEYDISRCTYQRQLDIIIIHNTNHEREITLRLSKYSEDMLDLINEFLLTSYENFELSFLQCSEIRAKRNNREDTESYKGSKTLYSSMVVLSYLLRY